MKKTILLLAAAGLIAASGCAKKSQAQTEPLTATRTVSTPARANAAPVVKTLPADVRGKDILPAIAAMYKGKVALIDFWATWCGPCRAAMKQVDAIKPELTEKGCVFVYVTGESSPLATWTEMIQGISGEHFRLTNEQWGELCKELGIPGIPSYLLLNKDGSRAYDNLSQGGYPGNDVVKHQVEVALTK